VAGRPQANAAASGELGSGVAASGELGGEATSGRHGNLGHGVVASGELGDGGSGFDRQHCLGSSPATLFLSRCPPMT
jgi:hypothetical protein